MKPLQMICFALLGLSSMMASATPNIVVLLVDDAGLMDFGGYGGEADTPNINKLADEGIRFSNYHTSPLCATSRAMLLTGLDNHKTGVATIPEVLTESQKNAEGYELHLLPEIETVASRLNTAGYETFMTGKWHLGSGPGQLPNAHGFDRSFVLDASGADNWEQKSFLPFYDEAPWFEDDKPATLPENFYSSRFIVDKMIEYLNNRDDKKPFFSYLAFQAIHIPVQAPKEYTEHYAGIYKEGWGAIRDKRFDKAKSLGLVPEDALAPAIHPKFRDWESLSEQDKLHYERSMMVNAGMLEAMDHHIGRLMAYLKSEGELENTIFIITSDNGPEFGEPTTSPIFRLWMSQNDYNSDIETLGEQGSMVAIGPDWASAAASPNSLFKMYASEGGTRVPLIVSGTGIRQSPGFNAALNFVTDITPTILDFAGVNHTDDLDGRSLRPLISGTGTAVYTDEDLITREVAGNSAVFKGRYKLTRNTLPHGDANWHLYDLVSDPAERTDISDLKPAYREEMLAGYQRYAQAQHVIELPKDYDVIAQVGINTRDKLWDRYKFNIALAIVVILLLILIPTVIVYQRRKTP